MAAPADDLRSPALANAVTILGFVLIFSTFATGSAWSWIIGGVVLVAGALWAGFGPTRPETIDRPTPDDHHVTSTEGARAVRQGATPPAQPASGRVEAAQPEQADGHAG